MKPPRHVPMGTATRRQANAVYDKQRTALQPWRRWYWTSRWRAVAKAQLSAEPLCAMCLQDGRVTPATVCDHVEPHRGNEVSFWDGKRQSLCASHHSRAKQREEAAGRTA